ncbi:hypothetical protein F5877DRAFT_90168 [Lentinula edodes]|nr:hypothetical protein F5877DRAFT_90168 [Lentinula edodes]
MFIFTPLLNTLLLGFIPLGIISQFLHWSTALRFSFSFLAAMNLTEFLNDTMEYIATGLDQKHTGILNASFGNIVKFFVGIAVLFQGKIVIMLGSILANMLLILGWSFLAVSLLIIVPSLGSSHPHAKFMILACITFTIPPTYCGFCTYQSLTLSDPEKWENVLIISRAASILLIVVYLAYLFFQLKTHGYLFENVDSFQEEDDDTQNKESQETSTMTYLVALWATTYFVVISLMEEFAEQYFIPRTFIGLILLPLVNVDGTSALRMAMRGQMKTTIDICIGSSIQIIAFVIPLLVLIGWISGHQFPLLFGIFEIITIFVSVLLTSDLLKDGRSNYLKGLILLSVYVVIALASSQL